MGTDHQDKNVARELEDRSSEETTPVQNPKVLSCFQIFNFCNNFVFVIIYIIYFFFFLFIVYTAFLLPCFVDFQTIRFKVFLSLSFLPSSSMIWVIGLFMFLFPFFFLYFLFLMFKSWEYCVFRTLFIYFLFHFFIDRLYFVFSFYCDFGFYRPIYPKPIVHCRLLCFLFLVYFIFLFRSLFG